MKVNSRSLLIGLSLICSQIVGLNAFAEDLAIALESAGIRSEPQFLAPVESTVPYGTQVQILSKQGAWMKVKHGNSIGWLHKSAFSKAEPILHDIGKGEAASKETYKDEVVTAGKGFSGADKDKKKEIDPKLKYDAVDKIEKRNVPAPKMKEFMEKGGLESKVIGK